VRLAELRNRRRPAWNTPLVTQKAIDATNKALAVMTALLDGTEGGNWEFAGKLVEDYTSNDAATADLVTGFINLGMVFVTEIKTISGESTDEEVLRKTSLVIAAMGDGEYRPSR
jgi:hypothetical protein